MKQNNDKVVIKEYVKKELLRSEARLEERLEAKIESEIGNLRQENKKYKDEILNKLVDISGKLDDMKTENEVGAYQIAEVRKDIKNYGGRLTKLEQTQKAV